MKNLEMYVVFEFNLQFAIVTVWWFDYRILKITLTFSYINKLINA